MASSETTNTPEVAAVSWNLKASHKKNGSMRKGSERSMVALTYSTRRSKTIAIVPITKRLTSRACSEANLKNLFRVTESISGVNSNIPTALPINQERLTVSNWSSDITLLEYSIELAMTAPTRHIRIVTKRN